MLMCVKLLAHNAFLLCIVSMLMCPYHVSFVWHFGVHPLLLVEEWKLQLEPLCLSVAMLDGLKPHPT